MPTHFTPEAMKFLRGLARNNDREWFEARRTLYERAVKAPMLALIDEIYAGMIEFAPEHVRPPHKVAMRIYRDIPFQPEQAALQDAPRGMVVAARHGEVLRRRLLSADQSTTGDGCRRGVYMPEREQLLALRRWMSAHHEAIASRSSSC